MPVPWWFKSATHDREGLEFESPDGQVGCSYPQRALLFHASDLHLHTVSLAVEAQCLPAH